MKRTALKIGTRLTIYWPMDDAHYPGTVRERNDLDGLHFIEYDDNVTEWLDLSKEEVHVLEKALSDVTQTTQQPVDAGAQKPEQQTTTAARTDVRTTNSSRATCDASQANPGSLVVASKEQFTAAIASKVREALVESENSGTKSAVSSVPSVVDAASEAGVDSCAAAPAEQRAAIASATSSKPFSPTDCSGAKSGEKVFVTSETMPVKEYCEPTEEELYIATTPSMRRHYKRGTAGSTSSILTNSTTGIATCHRTAHPTPFLAT